MMQGANSAEVGKEKKKPSSAWYSKHSIQFTGTSLGFISFTYSFILMQMTDPRCNVHHISEKRAYFKSVLFQHIAVKHYQKPSMLSVCLFIVQPVLVFFFSEPARRWMTQVNESLPTHFQFSFYWWHIGVGSGEIIMLALPSARTYSRVFGAFHAHSPQQQQQKPELALPFPFLLWQRGTEGALIPQAPGV